MNNECIIRTKLIDLNFLMPNLEEESFFQEEIIRQLDISVLSYLAKAVDVDTLLPDLNINGIVYRIGDLFVQLQMEQDIEITALALNYNEEELKICLLFIVKASSIFRKLPDLGKIASKAITILNTAEVSFSGMDLSEISIPDAKLNQAIFEGTQLQNADLSGTELREVWLRNANLTNTIMRNVNFGEWPYIPVKIRGNNLEVLKKEGCYHSKDGYLLAVGEHNDITIYNVLTRIPQYTLTGHTEAVTRMTFNANGTLLASGSFDKTIKLWSVETGKVLKTLSSHKGTVTCVAFSPNNELLVSASEKDTCFWVWSVESGTLQNTIEGHTSNNITSITFNPSGNLLVFGSKDKHLHLWSTNGWKLKKILMKKEDIVKIDSDTSRTESEERSKIRRDYHTNASAVNCVVFSHNGELLASSNSNTIRIWSMETEELQNTIINGHAGVNCIAFSPNGELLASASGNWAVQDDTVRLWLVKNGELQRTIRGHSATVLTVGFNPSGEVLISCSQDQTIRFWSVVEKEVQKEIVDHVDSVLVVSFTPTGELLASAGRDSCIKLWSVRNGKLKETLYGHTASITSMAFSPNGELIASGSRDKTIRLWSVKYLELHKLLCDDTSAAIDAIAFNANGKLLVSGSDNGSIWLWSIERGELLTKLCDYYNSSPKDAPSSIKSLIFSSKKNLLASCGSHAGPKIIQLWSEIENRWQRVADIGTIECLHSESLAFSPNGELLVSGGHDGIRLWSVNSGQLQYILSNISVNSLIFSQNGKILLSGSVSEYLKENIIQFWYLENKKMSDNFNRDIQIFKSNILISWLPPAFGLCLFQKTKNKEIYLATGHSDGAVRYWCIKDLEYPRVSLLWSSKKYLLANGVSLGKVQNNLSPLNIELLEQHDATKKYIINDEQKRQTVVSSLTSFDKELSPNVNFQSLPTNINSPITFRYQDLSTSINRQPFQSGDQERKNDKPLKGKYKSCTII